MEQSLFNPVQPADDWIMLYLVATVLLTCLLLGPHLHQFLDALNYAFNRKSLVSEIRTLTLPPVLSVGLSMVSLASVSLTAVLAGFEVPGKENGQALAAAVIFPVLFLTFFLKQFFVRTVNRRLYARQMVTIKPVRWNMFSSTLLAFWGVLHTLLNILAVFAGIPAGITFKASIVVMAIVETVMIVKIKTSLFSTQCNFLGIMLYLCTLEFGPLLFALVILGTNTVIH